MYLTVITVVEIGRNPTKGNHEVVV